MTKSKIERGDLVATYYLSTSMADEELLQYGVVVDINDWIGDVLVLDNNGQLRWWGKRRWRVLRKKKTLK